MQHQQQEALSDFVLFPPPSQFPSQPKMIAVDCSRPQHPTYFQPYNMDLVMDPYSVHMDHLNSFGQSNDSSRVPHSYYDTPSAYAESGSDLNKAPSFPPMPVTPPAIPTSQSSDPQISGLSSASGPSIASASSSAIGSPYSANAQAFPDNWINTNNGLVFPGAVMDDLVMNEYATLGLDGFYPKKYPDSFVDPSSIYQMERQPELSPDTFSYPEHSNYHMGFESQSASPAPIPENNPPEQASLPQDASPAMPSHSRPASIHERRSSVSSVQSPRSVQSPAASSVGSDEDNKEKGRCNDCGRVFKDLKAHTLTHQSERPEKCPITTCEYHTKGFARKYDKNRHTLTHYKGTMVCGFCPGSGSPAEKSFNRADVFKRHLTSVHGVEQTPPNCRRKTPNGAPKKTPTYCPDATGKCSTCSATFSNAQDFYEHLDDCVLRVVQQEEPSEAINQKRLAEVDEDEEVKKTMEKHMLLDTAGTVNRFDDENDDDENDDFKEPTISINKRSGKGSLKSSKGNQNGNSRPIIGGNNAVSKANGKARPTTSKRRNNRDHYPQSWGCPSSTMKTKKRVLCVFDGQRRLWKDEMMLDNEFEVRVKLPGGAGDGTNREAYVTDLDVETMKRVQGVYSANEEERGAWLDGPSNELMGRPAVPLPGLSHHQEDVDIDELMATSKESGEAVEYGWPAMS